MKPIAFMLDKNNQFPAEQVKKMGELGLMGLPYEKEYGGAGPQPPSGRFSQR